MTFVQFLALVLFINSFLLLLSACTVSHYRKSNEALRKALDESDSKLEELETIVKTYRDLEARVPTIEPAWGSDPSTEPSRESVEMQEEKAAIAALTVQRDNLERALMARRNHRINPVTFTDEDFMEEVNFKPSVSPRVQTVEVGIQATSLAKAERKAVIYLDAKYHRKWLRSTLVCVDDRRYEIMYYGQQRDVRGYLFKATVVK